MCWHVRRTPETCRLAAVVRARRRRTTAHASALRLEPHSTCSHRLRERRVDSRDSASAPRAGASRPVIGSGSEDR